MSLAYFNPSRCFQRFSLMLPMAHSTDFVENCWFIRQIKFWNPVNHGKLLMHISGISHCKGQAWSRRSTGSDGHYLLWDFLGSPDEIYTSDASNNHIITLAVQCKKTWWKSRKGQLIHQDRWQISWALQGAYHSDRLGAHFSLLQLHGNAAGHSF